MFLSSWPQYDEVDLNKKSCSGLVIAQALSPPPAFRGVHLHSDFEMSSTKNLVGGLGFFVYFELDFCRLHRQ